MKKTIREALEQRKEELTKEPMTKEVQTHAQPQPQAATLTITKEDLQALMAGVVAAAISESKKLNPIEQKKLDAEIEADKRRAEMVYQLGKMEEQLANAKKNGCSHSRWPNSSGAKSGLAAPKGQGEWVTGGQAHSNGTITLVCLRCGTAWRWIATTAEIQYALDAGLLGFPPPPDERLIKDKAEAA